ncbi:MAG: MoaD/ThiS family protein [Proteobacteria bacterium]|nr:MoaD/ThiS family protein [Pseudomonadota bacterium]
MRVDLPRAFPGAPDNAIVIDEPVTNIFELRREMKRRLPEAAAELDDKMLNIAVNGRMLLSGEGSHSLVSGDHVTLVPILAGG